MARTEYFAQPFPPSPFEIADGVILASHEFEAAANAVAAVATKAFRTEGWQGEALPFVIEMLEFHQIIPPRSHELAAALVTERAGRAIASKLGYLSRVQKIGDPPTIGARRLRRDWYKRS